MYLYINAQAIKMIKFWYFIVSFIGFLKHFKWTNKKIFFICYVICVHNRLRANTCISSIKYMKHYTFVGKLFALYIGCTLKFENITIRCLTWFANKANSYCYRGITLQGSIAHILSLSLTERKVQLVLKQLDFSRNLGPGKYEIR